ncbi:MAG: N-acetyltransferase family protein [Halanaeroarchaeum sp.]
MRVRPARPEDEEAVVAFTTDTWEERQSDYVPDVFASWVAGDDERTHTQVATIDDEPIGLVQTVLLSDHEAWQQGMRVAPAHRGEGVARSLSHAGFDWARDRGATVARNMVFSWNEQGLGLSRAAGFAPGPEFRWATPTPDPDATPAATVTDAVNAAWSVWRSAPARDALDGLGLHPEESWAVAEVTRDRLARASAAESLLVIEERGARAMAYRTRIAERERDGETLIEAVYGAAAWLDVESADALLAAIARDAAAAGADRTRVLVPETTAAVSDVAACRVDVSDDPDFVLAADLTAPYREYSPR